MFVVICGATASGKSSLAIETAKKINGEIVGADSMQIYKKMNVGTAKITAEETCGIPHYMIDVVEPQLPYSVAEYAENAKKIIKDIENRGKTPIICGGTGLYINALIYDFSMSSYDPELRENLYKEAEEKGIDYMYEKLLSVDPLAVKIHKNNKKRVIRALEVYYTEGKSILSKRDTENSVPHLIYSIDMPRETLYDRVDKRVDAMFDNGLCEEVDSLLNEEKLTFDMQSMQAIGYKEFKGYYNSEYDKDTLKNLIKQHTRNYAKRQLTWFKRIQTCKWLDFSVFSDLSSIIEQDYYIKSTKL